VAIAKEKLLEMYRNMIIARRVEDKLNEFLTLPGRAGMPWLHRRVGEEAVPIAVCANLRKDDYYHPNFGQVSCNFAKGLSLVDLFASECSRARHTGSIAFDLNYGLLAWTGSLGEDVGFYTGAAITAMLRKTGQISFFICGDGAASRGPIHENMVFATSWNLPIVFAIQNNQYGMGTSAKKIYKIKDLSERAKAYGFPGETVDGNDVIACYEVVKKHVDRTRNGGGPSLIVFETYRLRGHYEGDPQIYRPKGEVEEWWKKDPIPRYQKKLMEMGILTEDDVSRIDKEVMAEVEEAAKAGLEVPFRTIEDYKKTVIGAL